LFRWEREKKTKDQTPKNEKKRNWNLQ